ncbi:MAG: hypothetical protein GY810_11405 [Aureispira sp.]|nr:hypothetical protein [Aureispira sp.]
MLTKKYTVAFILFVILISLLDSCSPTKVVLNKEEDKDEDLELPEYITELPDYLFKIRKPIELYIYKMKIDTFPAKISRLKNLRSLFLRDSEISYLPESFGQLKKMKSLIFLDSDLKKMPQSFNKLKGLEQLGLCVFCLDSLSSATICELKNLKELYLEAIETLPTCLLELPKLKKIGVRGFNVAITTSQSILWQLTNLEDLSIHHETNLEQIPEELGQLQKLKRLNLMGNNLKKLPKSLWTLTNLEILYLQDNRFDSSVTVALENINKLKNLKDFRIGAFDKSNSIVSLPESIGELVDLEILELTGAELTSLPQSISSLKKLKRLYLGYNELTILPDLSSLKKLEELSLYDNEMTVIPDLSNLTKLEYLSISNNPIDSIPGLEHLKKLKSLNIAWTKIDTIPRSTLKKLKSLEKLSIDTHQKYDFKKEYNWEELLPNCEIRVVSEKY